MAEHVTFSRAMQRCPLCEEIGGTLVLRNGFLRIVLVDDADLPGFLRVILEAHAREMTDLDAPARTRLMDAVFRAERVVRDIFDPLKVNVASLGNAVPHVHWHVIPRFADDAFSPQPIWGVRQRETAADVLAARRARVPALEAALVAAMAGPAI